MQILRTIGWIVLTIIAVSFIAMNMGEPQAVRFWPLSGGNALLFEWPIGFIAMFFFLLGLIPTWLLHRGVKWRLNRRIKTLENAVRATAVTAPVSPASNSAPVTPEAASKLGTENATSGDTFTP